MGTYKPPVKGSVRVKPGRKTIWLARPSTLSVGLGVVAFVVVGLGAVTAGVPIGPWVWYHLKPSVTTELGKLLHKPVVAQEQTQTARTYDTWQPEVDPTLPKGGWMKIEAIQFDSEIYEASSDHYETALERGVWRVPEFGTPLARQLPMILAAHRFGYLAWSNQYRREHSFFNLPKLRVGDRIEIDWGQRRYWYQVYAADQGTQISDYTADLILYTCQYLESDQRIFRYARLVKM